MTIGNIYTTSIGKENPNSPVEIRIWKSVLEQDEAPRIYDSKKRGSYAEKNVRNLHTGPLETLLNTTSLQLEKNLTKFGKNVQEIVNSESLHTMGRLVGEDSPQSSLGAFNGDLREVTA